MSAADHHATATQLLADVNETIDTPSAARVLTQAAIAHALLGLLEIQMGRAQPAVVSMVDACEWFITTDVFSRGGEQVAGPV